MSRHLYNTTATTSSPSPFISFMVDVLQHHRPSRVRSWPRSLRFPFSWFNSATIQIQKRFSFYITTITYTWHVKRLVLNLQMKLEQLLHDAVTSLDIKENRLSTPKISSDSHLHFLIAWNGVECSIFDVHQ
jgi:hypothetical protein